MTSDIDPTIEDMIRSAYRISWPGPAPRRPLRVRRMLGRMVRLCRRQTLQGWPVMLSAPKH